MSQKKIFFFLFISIMGCHPPISQRPTQPQPIPVVATQTVPETKRVEKSSIPVLFNTRYLGTKAGYHFRLIDRGFIVLPETVAEELKKENVPLVQMNTLLPQIQVFKYVVNSGWATRELSAFGTQADYLFSLFYSWQQDVNLVPISSGNKKIPTPLKKWIQSSKKPWVLLASQEQKTEVLLRFSEPQKPFFAQVQFLSASIVIPEQIIFSYESSEQKTCAILQKIKEIESKQFCVRVSFSGK